MENSAADTKSASGAKGTEMDKPAEVNSKHDGEQYKLPDTKTLQEAGGYMIKDENGKETAFKSLYEAQEGRQLIIFIRHFFCGSCEEYVRVLAGSLPPSALSTTTPPTTLTLIGCGQPDCISDYRTRTMSALEKPYPIYCDPSRKLYTKFNMAINLQQGKTPEYATMSMPMITLTSMRNAIGTGMKAFKGGKVDQNGGEWLFEGGQLKWCHRMMKTNDHAEVSELKEVLVIS